MPYVLTPGCVRGYLQSFVTTAESTFNIISATALNISNNSIAAIFFTPKQGLISQIGVGISNRNGTGGGYTARLETVATRAPTGTLRDPNAYVGWVPGATGWTWQSFLSAVSVAAGELVAGRIDGTSNASLVTNPTNNSIFIVRLSDAFSRQFPFALTRLAAAWTAGSSAPCIALKYSDGEIIYGSHGRGATTNITTDLNTGAAIVELGNYFIANQALDCFGAAFMIFCASDTSTFSVYLVENSNIIRTVSLSGISIRAIGSWGLAEVQWSSPYTFIPGNNYRVTIRATSASPLNTRVSLMEAGDSSLRDRDIGDMWRTQKAGAAYSEPNTNQFVGIVPLIAGVTSGGGLLTHPGMCGGIDN